MLHRVFNLDIFPSPQWQGMLVCFKLDMLLLGTSRECCIRLEGLVELSEVVQPSLLLEVVSVVKAHS